MYTVYLHVNKINNKNILDKHVKTQYIDGVTGQPIETPNIYTEVFRNMDGKILIILL